MLKRECCNEITCKMGEGSFYLPTYPFIPIATRLLCLPTCQPTHPLFHQFTFYSPVCLSVHSLSIHPSIHPSCYLQFWLSGSYTHICVQYQRIKRWGYLCIFLCLLFYQGYLSLLLLVLRHCPAPFLSLPDSLKFLHSIFSVEIKPCYTQCPVSIMLWKHIQWSV